MRNKLNVAQMIANFIVYLCCSLDNWACIKVMVCSHLEIILFSYLGHQVKYSVDLGVLPYSSEFKMLTICQYQNL